MPFLPPNQQRQSTEGIKYIASYIAIFSFVLKIYLHIHFSERFEIWPQTVWYLTKNGDLRFHKWFKSISGKIWDFNFIWDLTVTAVTWLSTDRYWARLVVCNTAKLHCLFVMFAVFLVSHTFCVILSIAEQKDLSLVVKTGVLSINVLSYIFDNHCEYHLHVWFDSSTRNAAAIV